MKKIRLWKKIVTLMTTLMFVFSITVYSTSTASAFDMNYLSSDGMELAYRIVNGYSKLAYKNGLNEKKTAVYCGLDVTEPYLLTIGGVYLLTHKIDFDKLLVDNEYAVEKVAELDKYLSKMGVKNEKAKKFKENFKKTYNIELKGFDAVGMYFIESDAKFSEKLMKNEFVDFVMAGGEVPKTMKDLNLDGKSNEADAQLIQKYIARSISYEDEEEKEYIEFACDINGDKKINIMDATELEYLSKGIKVA